MSKEKVQEKISSRVPIITVLGHVDHGKTSLLDKIRGTDIQSREAGGITQKVSVFSVETEQYGTFTFIDTPGHEAFDIMRSQGGSIADIVLLVVSAVDGVKPQTEESIGVIQKSKAHPIVVINKIDLPSADVERVKRELVNAGLLLEGLGGTVPVVEVSAKTGAGIEQLLETIRLVVDVEGLKSYTPEYADATAALVVLDSVKHKFKGNTALVICTYGSVSKGDFIIYQGNSGVVSEKVKAFYDFDQKQLSQLMEGFGAELIGMKDLLPLGSKLYVAGRKSVKTLVKALNQIKEDEEAKVTSKATGFDIEDLESFLADDQEDDVKKLNVIIKASSAGSLISLRNSIEKIEVPEGVELNIIDASVGDITLGDVEKASLTKAIILGFEVRVESRVQKTAQDKKVTIRVYDIIYKLNEELEEVLTLLAAPKNIEEEIGQATIKQLFTLSNGEIVLGSIVNEGVIKRDRKVLIVRDDEIIVEGRIKSLKRNKNEVTTVEKGFDFGMILSVDTKDVQIGDIVHCFETIK